MARPLLDASELTAITDGAAHLQGKLGDDILVHRAQGLDAAHHHRDAFIERYRRPAALRLARKAKRRLDLGARRGLAPRHFAAVDGRYANDVGHDGSSNHGRRDGSRDQMISKYRASSQSVMAR